MNKEKIKDIIILILAIIGAIFFSLRSCNENKQPIKKDSSGIDSVINVDRQQANIIAMETSRRMDSMKAMKLIVKDSIVKTFGIIYRYQNTTDTVKKIIDCDSIIIQYGFLQKSYTTNDSLHLINEHSLQLEASDLNHAIDTAQFEIRQLTDQQEHEKKQIARNRKLAFVSTTVAIAEAGIIYFITKTK